MCFFGGGYLRLFPYQLIRTMGQRALQRRAAGRFLHSSARNRSRPTAHAAQPPPPIHLLREPPLDAAKNPTHLARLSSNVFRQIYLARAADPVNTAVNVRTSEFLTAMPSIFNSSMATTIARFDQVANRLFRRSMLVRFQKTLAGCQPIEDRDGHRHRLRAGTLRHCAGARRGRAGPGPRFRPRHAQDRARSRRCGQRGATLHLRAGRFPYLSDFRTVRLCDRDGLYGLRWRAATGHRTSTRDHQQARFLQLSQSRGTARLATTVALP